MKYLKINREILLGLIIFIGCRGCTSTPELNALSTNDTGKYNFTLTNDPTHTLSRTSIPTKTKKATIKPTNKYTSLPTIDPSSIPNYLLTSVSDWPYTASEIVYLFNLLKMSFTNHDPMLLLDFLQFPLKEVNRCPGDIIETPEEFIERFPEITNQVTKEVIENMKIENIILRQREYLGFNIVSPYDVWFAFYCSNNECGYSSTHHIILDRFFNYAPYYEVIEGFPSAEPTYDQSLINYGVYKVTSKENNIIKSSGELTSLDEKSSFWKDFTIKYTKTSISMGPFANIKYENIYYFSCTYPTVEVCQWEDHPQFSSGGYSRGQLLFICDNRDTDWIMIMDNNQLGHQFWSKTQTGYIILDLVEKY